mmetsp:Transcript_34395/g.109193  ORF Transcript_34395/g.109193 Transcript_34395/m.109193 type:complete len:309 (+) Transcript_34395:374-1300(+)
MHRLAPCSMKAQPAHRSTALSWATTSTAPRPDPSRMPQRQARRVSSCTAQLPAFSLAAARPACSRMVLHQARSSTALLQALKPPPARRRLQLLARYLTERPLARMQLAASPTVLRPAHSCMLPRCSTGHTSGQQPQWMPRAAQRVAYQQLHNNTGWRQEPSSTARPPWRSTMLRQRQAVRSMLQVASLWILCSRLLWPSTVCTLLHMLRRLQAVVQVFPATMDLQMPGSTTALSSERRHASTGTLTRRTRSAQSSGSGVWKWTTACARGLAGMAGAGTGPTTMTSPRRSERSPGGRQAAGKWSAPHPC